MDEYKELINRLRQEAEWEAYLQPHSANETPKLLSEAADVIEELSGERKNGKWTLNKDGSGTCSECGRRQNNCWDADSWDNFCHFCGADMR